MTHEPDTSSARKAHTLLSPEARAQLLQEWVEGHKVARLARRYGVHRSTIHGWIKDEGRERASAPPPPRLPPPTAMARRRRKVSTLSEASKLSISEILNGINDDDQSTIDRFAKIAAIVDRLKRSEASKPSISPERSESPPAFRPLQDVLEFLAERGLRPEDVT